MASGLQNSVEIKVLLQRNNQLEEGNVQVLFAALKACSRTRNLERGKQIHAEVIRNGHDNIYVLNAITSMYAKCGSMVDAREVFDGMHPDIVSWNTLIMGYTENGLVQTSLDLFAELRIKGHSPNSLTFIAALKACTSLKDPWDPGKGIHNIAVENGCNSNVYVQSTLIHMYAKSGSMNEAHVVFDGMKHPDVVSWTALILGYAENAQGHKALDLFTKMRSEGPPPNSVTFVAILKSFSSIGGTNRWAECRDRSKEIHNFAVENGCNSDVYLQSTLVDSYAKCSSMVDARDVFDWMKRPTIVSWTALIVGYADNGQGRTALDLFARMRINGPAPDSVTFVAALRACSSLEGAAECKDRGKEIHNVIVGSGCNSDAYVESALVDMYSKCGSMTEARVVFDDDGQGYTALDIFARMKSEGFAPDTITLVAALKACTSLAMKDRPTKWEECMGRGKKIHSIIVEKGCNSHVHVQSTLVDMYSECGGMMDAREVFDCAKNPDTVSWTVLILGYANNGQSHTALELFAKMKCEGFAPNSVIFGAVLKVCGLVGALEFGRTIHSEIDSGNDLGVVLVTCLVDFYAKCGSLVEAQSVFNLYPQARDIIIWNALLAGFSSCGDFEAMFELFEEMQNAGFKPDGITFLCILTCCTHVGLVVEGKECFDAMSTKNAVVPSIKHYTCVIDLLGRANKLADVMALLKGMPCSPDDVTWMTILSSCRKWKNVEIGRLAFRSLIDLNDKDASAYILMAQIYASRGMLQEQKMLIGIKKNINALRRPRETCWTNEAGHVHMFLSENSAHPQIHEIRGKWESMMRLLMTEHGYTPLSVTADAEKEALCGHSVTAALVCALINTESEKTVRSVSSFRICDDCHTAAALISKLESRTIICKDAKRIHVFNNAKCSCGEHPVIKECCTPSNIPLNTKEYSLTGCGKKIFCYRWKEYINFHEVFNDQTRGFIPFLSL